MKKLILSIIFLFAMVCTSWPQDLLGFEFTSGNDKIDYKNAEPKALEAANYLLTIAFDSSKIERDKALTLMLMWMEGTPDYVFYIDENIGVFTRSSKALLSIYMACLAKNCLEDPVLAKDRNELKYKSIEEYLEYCLNPSNHVKSYRELEQLVKARDKGRLGDYIEN
jgi:roadblock/LC7 domain-containing protein